MFNGWQYVQKLGTRTLGIYKCIDYLTQNKILLYHKIIEIQNKYKINNLEQQLQL